MDKGIPPYFVLHVAEHPDTAAQVRRLGKVLNAAGVPATVFGARDSTYKRVNEELGRPVDPATKALFTFLDNALKMVTRIGHGPCPGAGGSSQCGHGGAAQATRPMADSPLSDDDDLARARAGDTPVLGRLLLPYGDFLHILARLQIRRRLQGKVDAADHAQEFFFDAHRQFPQFRGETRASFGAWLRSILAGKLAALIRRNCLALICDVSLEQSLGRELESSSDQLRQGVTGGHLPKESAMRREEVSHHARALEALPSDYREVILLRQIEGLPFATVAAKMGRSEDRVQLLRVHGLDAVWRILESPAPRGGNRRGGPLL